MLAKCGFDVAPPLNRQYFQAVYFRGPYGVNYAIVTDGPGFASLRRRFRAILISIMLLHDTCHSIDSPDAATIFRVSIVLRERDAYYFPAISRA